MMRPCDTADFNDLVVMVIHPLPMMFFSSSFLGMQSSKFDQKTFYVLPTPPSHPILLIFDIKTQNTKLFGRTGKTILKQQSV